jgi:hypothetical protein
MRRFLIRRVPRWRGRYQSDEAGTSDQTVQTTEDGKDDKPIAMKEMFRNYSAQSDRRSVEEYPWKRTVARPLSRQTFASAEGVAQLLPPRPLEPECFEVQQGPDGKQALVRCDIDWTQDRDITSCRRPLDLGFPDFDEDD